MKKTLLSLSLLFTSTLLTLLAIEFGLSIVYPQNLSLSYRTRDGLNILRPSHEGVYRGVETAQLYQTNSFGMRDREHQLEKPNGTYRILLLGDSFMEALQVPFERSFAPRLESMLKRTTGRPTEVINAAVSGWGTDDELTYLKRYGQRFRPDLILVAMTMTNDVSDNLAEKFHHLEGGKLRESAVQTTPWLQYKVWQLKAFFGAYSHLYQLTRLWFHLKDIEAGGQQLNRHVEEQFRKKPTERMKKGWQLTFELLGEIERMGNGIGAGVVIVLIPVSSQLDEAKMRSLEEAHGLSPDVIDIDGPQRMIKAFAGERKIGVVDLLPTFREQTQKGRLLVLKQDGHWTEAGHEAACNIVSHQVIGRITGTGISPIPTTAVLGSDVRAAPERR